MFNNIGMKIKRVAKLFCWIGIIASIVAGIIMIVIGTSARSRSGALVGFGFGIAVLGPLFSWLNSIVLYGIGEAAENSTTAASLAMKAEKE